MTGKSQKTGERIYKYIIKMVDEEQDFNEEDEGNLSQALDEAREGN